jgi:nucleotide-binding universal stress UspA family protein
MVTFQTIVCAVDFSDQSRVALIRAAAWARHFGARLTVVTVVEPLLANAAAAVYDMDLAREEVLPELRAFVEKVQSDGIVLPPWDAIVLTGEPADQIVGYQPADLIVIATQGLSGYRKLLLGSTTERVLRQTRVPVLVVPPGEQTAVIKDATLQVGRVLAPVDFDSACVTDAQAAADIAEALGAPLLMLHVVAPVRGLDRLRSALETHNRIQGELAGQQMQRLAAGIQGGEVETSIVSGPPAEEIARIAVDRGAGLIVMGLRGQTRLFGARPGSIAYRVLGLAPAMILALPPRAAA